MLKICLSISRLDLTCFLSRQRLCLFDSCKPPLNQGAHGRRVIFSFKLGSMFIKQLTEGWVERVHQKWRILSATRSTYHLSRIYVQKPNYLHQVWPNVLDWCTFKIYFDLAGDTLILLRGDRWEKRGDWIKFCLFMYTATQ